MFTYICPKCGREVPPAYSDCPDCAAKEAGITVPPLVVRGPEPKPAPEPLKAEPPAPKPVEQPAPAPAAQPAYVPSQPAAASPLFAPASVQAQPAAPQPVATAPGWAAPMWLLTILFAFSILGVVLGGAWLFSTLRGGNHPAAAAADTSSAKAGAAANPLQRYVEISGLRYVEDPKNKDKTLVKFVLTNHSDADLPAFSANVTLLGHTPKAVIPEGTFTFTTDLAPGAVKDMSAPLTTTKMIYELPDWQNASADMQITGPGGASAGSPARQ